MTIIKKTLIKTRKKHINTIYNNNNNEVNVD